MFTGLVETAGTVTSIVDQPPGKLLSISASGFTAGIDLGASVSVNGCCLTVIGNNADTLTFEAGEETLRRTTFSDLQTNDVVNLERSLRVGDELGGHWVTGHIDTVGTITQRNDQGDWSEIWCEVPPEFTSQLVSKGSVAMDGVSLTVVKVVDCQFSVALIPHTLSLTTLGDRQAGDRMNIETDILAKYVERQLQSN
ncbi:MAG: riboflavin synthase [Pirellulaceae bacterium]|nr:riboflavin synthase [Pirellulaceae bacterium]